MCRARTRSLAQTDLLDDTERQQALGELRPAIDAITKRMHQLIGSYDSWDATMSLWAYAQLGHHDEGALRALCDVALEVAPIFKPPDCANVVVAFAYLDFMHTGLLRQIVTTVLDTMEDFQPGEICQVLWGFAKLNCHPGAAFLAEVVDAVHCRLEQYGTQEIGMVLWSLVRLNYKPGLRFLHDVESVLLQRLPHMAPVDVCLSVWSLSRLRYKAVRLLDEVPQAVGPQLRNCKNSELCSLVSGYATAHHYHRVLLDAVAEVVLSRLDTLSHVEVCIVLWTYGTFRHRPAHADFGKQLAAALYSRMAHFSPQGLAMITKALAQLQWRSEPLLVELIASAEPQLPAFKPLEMSQLLWGLSALQYGNLSIYYAVVRRCIAILKDPRNPHYRTMMHHRVVNSIIVSCQRLGYVPWTLIDFAESKGIRVKQPDILSSRDEDDEGIMSHPLALAPEPRAMEGMPGAEAEGLADIEAALGGRRAARVRPAEDGEDGTGLDRLPGRSAGAHPWDEEVESDSGAAAAAELAPSADGDGGRQWRRSEQLRMLQLGEEGRPQQSEGGLEAEAAAALDERTPPMERTAAMERTPDADEAGSRRGGLQSQHRHPREAGLGRSVKMLTPRPKMRKPGSTRLAAGHGLAPEPALAGEQGVQPLNGGAAYGGDMPQAAELQQGVELDAAGLPVNGNGAAAPVAPHRVPLERRPSAAGGGMPPLPTSTTRLAR